MKILAHNERLNEVVGFREGETLFLRLARDKCLIASPANRYPYISDFDWEYWEKQKSAEATAKPICLGDTLTLEL